MESAVLDMSCKHCGEQTAYKCIGCDESVCNKISNCSTFADETVKGWKAGSRVGYCQQCQQRQEATASAKEDSQKQENTNPKVPKTSYKTTAQDLQEQRLNTKPAKVAETSSKSTSSSKRVYFDLSRKVDLIRFSEENTSVGLRKQGEKFGCSKSQVQRILKNKAEIIQKWESNDSSGAKKKDRHQKFEDINDFLWEWYKRCRTSNIPVSGPCYKKRQKP